MGQSNRLQALRTKKFLKAQTKPSMRIADGNDKPDSLPLLAFYPSVKSFPPEEQGHIGKWRREIWGIVEDGHHLGAIVFDDRAHHLGLARTAP